MDHLIIRPVAAELHQQLPWWVGYASMVTMIALFSLAALVLGGIGAAVAGMPLINSRDKPWHERARQAYSLRVLLGMQMLVWPMVALVICSMWPLPFGFQSLAWRCFPPAIATLAILALLRFAGERRILKRRYSIWQLMCNTIVYHFALGHVTLIVALLAVIAMQWQMNLKVPIIACAAALAIVFFSCGGSLLVLRGLGLLYPADDRLNRIVRDCAKQLEFPTPITYIARMPSANALAFPWNGRLVFSEGILRSLNDEQLHSIAAHEICHLGMPTSQKIMRTVHALAILIPFTLIKPVWGTFGNAAIIPSLLGFLAIVIVLQILGRRLMRREEERADRAGAETNEAVYALALEQIYRENLMPANMKSPQGHPPLYDRMVASGVTPDYQKPKPPPAWIRHVAVLAQAAMFMAMTIFLVIAYSMVQAFVPVTVNAQQAVLAIAGGRMSDVSRLGDLYVDEGEGALGLSLMEYAKDEAPYEVEVLSRLAGAYAHRGRCDEAQELLAAAEENLLYELPYQRMEAAYAAAERAVAGCQ